MTVTQVEADLLNKMPRYVEMPANPIPEMPRTEEDIGTEDGNQPQAGNECYFMFVVREA
jgi:hypothetical protein